MIRFPSYGSLQSRHLTNFPLVVMFISFVYTTLRCFLPLFFNSCICIFCTFTITAMVLPKCRVWTYFFTLVGDLLLGFSFLFSQFYLLSSRFCYCLVVFLTLVLVSQACSLVFAGFRRTRPWQCHYPHI